LLLVNLGPAAVFSFFKNAIKYAVIDIPDTIAQVREKIFNPQDKIIGGSSYPGICLYLLMA
jgi:hypothetical protein